MKIRLSFLLVFLSLLWAGSQLNATTITLSTTGGTWATAANWNPAQIPTASDSVVIPAGMSVSVGAVAYCQSLTISGTVTTTAKLYLGNNSTGLGGQLTINNGGSLTISTDLLCMNILINSGGTLKSDGTSNRAILFGYLGSTMKSKPCIVTNNGTFGTATATGGSGAWIRVFYSDQADSVVFRGTGNTNISAVMPVNVAASGKNTLLALRQSMSLCQGSGSGISLSTYNGGNGATGGFTRTVLIPAGVTVINAGRFHTNNAVTYGAQGKSVYNIYGTLDLATWGGEIDLYGPDPNTASTSTDSVVINVGDGTPHNPGTLILGKTIKVIKTSTRPWNHIFRFSPYSTVIFGTLNNGNAAPTFTLTLDGVSTPSYFANSFYNVNCANSAGVALPNLSTVSNQLSLTSGALSSDVTMVDGTSIVRTNGTLTGTCLFGGTVNVTYNGSTSISTGNELPVHSLYPSSLINLTVNNSGGVTLGNATKINGTLTLSSGTLINTKTLTISSGANIVRIAGALSTDPTFEGTVNLMYSNSSSLTSGFEIPSLSGVLTNLTMDGLGGVTLAKNADVSGMLTLSNGKLTLVTYNLTAANTSGGNSLSYIATNSTGSYIRNKLSSSATTLPIGTTSSYAPITLTGTTNTPNITSSVKSSFDATPQDVTGIVNLQWSVLSNVSSTSSIGFQFNSSDKASSCDLGSSFDLGNFTDSWLALAVGTPVGSNPYTITVPNLSIPTSSPNYYVVGNTGKVANSAPTNSIWNGSVDANWTTQGNWSNGIPDATMDAIIPASLSNYPIISSGIQTIKSLTVASGATIINNATLNITGSTVTLNSAVSGNGIYVLNSASGQIITGSSANISNLTINNTNGVSLSSSLNVAGSLSLISGNLTIGSNTLTLQGATSGSGLIVSSSGSTVAYAGSMVQSITNLNSNTVYNLTINNITGVSLSSGIIVNGTLLLSSGDLITGTNSLILNSGTAVGSGNIVTSATSTVIYSGSSPQVISGFKDNSVYNLTLNNSTGAALGSNVTVVGLLTLTSGELNNTSDTLFFASGASIIRTGGQLTSAPVFVGTVNLTYNNSSPQITSYELPKEQSVLNNLSINNTSGLSSASTLYINGDFTTTGNITANVNFTGNNAQTVNANNKTIIGVVTSNSSSTVTVGSTTLNITGGLIVSGGTLTNSGQVNIAGDLTVNNGGTLNMQTTIYCGNVTVNEGGILNANSAAGTNRNLLVGFRGTTPQTGSFFITNNGVFGTPTAVGSAGVGSGIRILFSENCANLTVQGTGASNISAIIENGGPSTTTNNDFTMDIKQSISLGNNTGISLSVQNNTGTKDANRRGTRICNIWPGVIVLAGGRFHTNQGAPSTQQGSFIYNINGKLDLASWNGEFDLYGTTGSADTITVNVGPNGTLQTGNIITMQTNCASQVAQIVPAPGSRIIYGRGEALNNTFTSNNGGILPGLPISYSKLFINSSNGITFSNPISVTDSLTMITGNITGTLTMSGSSNQILTANGNSITNLIVNNSFGVTGTPVVSGTLTLTNGNISDFSNLSNVNIIFNGNSMQSLGYGLSTVNNLTINNASGISLDCDPTVNGILNITSGKLTLGNHNLTIGASGAISQASPASNYIVTDGTGMLIMNAAASSSKTYPVGTSSTYNPVTLNPASSATFYVGVKNTISPSLQISDTTIVPVNSINRTWNISTSNPSSATITFGYDGTSDKNSGFSSSKPVSLLQYTGSKWEYVGSGSISQGIGYTTAMIAPFEGIGSFSSFVLVNPGENAIYVNTGNSLFSNIFRSTGNGYWGSSNLWELYDNAQAAWSSTVLAPDSSSTVTILAGDTVTINSAAGVGNLTIENGGVLKSVLSAYTSSPYMLKIGKASSSITNNGLLGCTIGSLPGSIGDGISLVLASNCQSFILNGTGQTGIGSLYALASPNNLNIVINQNIQLRYSSSGAKKTALSLVDPNATAFTGLRTLTVNVGKTVSFLNAFSCLHGTVFSSTGSYAEQQGNITYDIQGTLDLKGGNVYITSSKNASSAAQVVRVNVGSAGSVIANGDFNFAKALSTQAVYLNLEDGALIDASAAPLSKSNFYGPCGPTSTDSLYVWVITNGNSYYKRYCGTGATTKYFNVAVAPTDMDYVNLKGNPLSVSTNNSRFSDVYTVNVNPAHPYPITSFDSTYTINRTWTIKPSRTDSTFLYGTYVDFGYTGTSETDGYSNFSATKAAVSGSSRYSVNTQETVSPTSIPAGSTDTYIYISSTGYWYNLSPVSYNIPVYGSTLGSRYKLHYGTIGNFVAPYKFTLRNTACPIQCP